MAGARGRKIGRQKPASRPKPKAAGKPKEEVSDLEIKRAYAQYYENRRLVDSGETFRSRRESEWRRRSRKRD